MADPPAATVPDRLAVLREAADEILLPPSPCPRHLVGTEIRRHHRDPRRQLEFHSARQRRRVPLLASADRRQGSPYARRFETSGRATGPTATFSCLPASRASPAPADATRLQRSSARARCDPRPRGSRESFPVAPLADARLAVGAPLPAAPSPPDRRIAKSPLPNSSRRNRPA